MTTVGVDLGGTNILAAVVDDDHNVVASVKVPTPQDGPEGVVNAIAESVRSLQVVPDAVGVGAPGPVSDGTVLTAPNLAGWSEPVPLASLVATALNARVVVDNDATVGAFGEWVAGAGRGARAMLGVWLGTGVGGGLVFDGRPFGGAYGGAGEFGHMVVERDGALCGCGRRGCLEAYAGRRALQQAADALRDSGRHTILHALATQRGKANLTAGVWARALASDDAVAHELIDRAVRALGMAVANAVNLLDLDCIVVGGGLAEKLGTGITDRIDAAARPHMLVPDIGRRVALAALGDHAGVVGAAALTREEIA
jgi:glucokinase